LIYWLFGQIGTIEKKERIIFMKKIQVLGTGCSKCKKLFEVTQKVVKELGIEAEVMKVEDINEIMQLGVMTTPALVVDGAVKVVGRIPKPDELKTLIS
jgi:small redox-active disulfide protein 2